MHASRVTGDALMTSLSSFYSYSKKVHILDMLSLLRSISYQAAPHAPCGLDYRLSLQVKW